MNTSYFAKYRNGAGGVSIALYPPRGFAGKRYKALAPPDWLLKRYKQAPDEEQYTRDYKTHVLDKLDPKQVFKDLGPDAVLLCFEAPDKFCHRRLVARWLEKHLSIIVDEL